LDWQSLLALAIFASASAMIAAIARGLSWGEADKIVLMAATMYMVLAVGWVATLFGYRKISPKYKLVIPRFHFLCDDNTGSEAKESRHFQAEINLQNIAEFPISYIVDQIDFRIQNTLAGGELTNQGATIDAGRSSNFRSTRVTFHHPVSLPVDGTLKLRVRYGKPGSERFRREANLQVRYIPDLTKPSGVRYEWAYFPEKRNRALESQRTNVY
jgi:hypothetical protein